MHSRSWSARVALVGLLLATLACDTVLRQVVEGKREPLLNVVVNPLSGSGTFTVTAALASGTYEPGESLRCSYPDATGMNNLTSTSGQVDPDNQDLPFTHTFSFELTTPGDYMVSCVAQAYHSSPVNGYFTVTEAAVEPPAELPPVFTSAVIGFYLSETKVDIEAANPGAMLNDFCWPPTSQLQGRGANAVGSGEFVVSETGALSGFCKLTGGGTPEDPLTMDGSLTGQFDATTGAVTFHLESTRSTSGTQPGPHSATFTWIADGVGALAEDNTAYGEATFTWALACTGEINCQPPLSATGTVPFDIVFYP